MTRLLLTSLIVLMCTVSTQSRYSYQINQLKIPFKGKFFTTDALGNVFLANRDNSIVKYDKAGNVKARVNFKIYGEISRLDVSNPFEIYAYYRDQQTVLILDNLLSILSTIDLNDMSTGEISATCRSFDNGLWFFDAGNMRLKKTDKGLNLKQEGLPFATWTSDKWNPIQMLDNEKHLFILDSTRGVAVFDIFANYYKTINIKGLRDFQVRKNQLYFYQDSLLQRYDFTFLNFDTLYKDASCNNIRFDANQLYTWKQDTVYILPTWKK